MVLISFLERKVSITASDYIPPESVPGTVNERFSISRIEVLEGL